MKFILLVLLLMAIVNCGSYPQIQREIYIWLNRVRRNPRSLIPHIQRQMHKFDGNVLKITPGFHHKTKQGKDAWEQAIQFLRRQKPMTGLKRHIGLDLSSKDHCHYLAITNRVSHSGPNGGRVRSRIQKYAFFQNGQIGQNIGQQFAKIKRNHGLETVISLIIDDGRYRRDHRTSLFTRNFNYVGISTQRSKSHYVTVINLSSQNLVLKRGHKGRPQTSRYPRRITKTTVTTRTTRHPVLARQHPYPTQQKSYFRWSYVRSLFS